MVRMVLAALAGLLLAGCSTKSGPPYSPEEERKRLVLPPGFRIELVAAEPDVEDPVAMTFDEAGRIYVVEMRDYPMGDSPAGRLRLLEDRDGDGRFETSTVFAGDLKLPNGVMRWRKGIVVTSTPDILYFEDTNNDGKADIRKVVLTGFASQNPQLRLNGPQYGIDNWIYVAYPRRHIARRYAKEFGDTGHPIRMPERPEVAPLDVHSRDIRFRLDQGKIQALAGFSQFGWGYNEWADRFTVWNSDHVRHVPIDGATFERNPELALPPLAMESVSDHKAQSTVYPVTENPLYIHDSQVGQFTSACGLSLYTGANFPPDFQNNSFTCEPVHNLVHRDILKPKGGTYTASRAYEKSEFLASKDAWFRPVFTMTGPDGALYVVDLYRDSVEHPEFVPPEMLKDLDFSTKPHKGRIWRVVHETSKPRPRPRLDQANSAQLVEALNDPNLWWRINAQRLLVDRQAKDPVPALATLARNGATPQARVHALHTLEGLGALDAALVAAALADSHPSVRRHGIRLAPPNLVLGLANDPDPQVRYEAALAIASLDEDRAFPALLEIALRDPGDSWLQLVVLSNARRNPFRWFQALTRQPDPESSFVGRTAALVATHGADKDVAAVLSSPDRPWRAAAVAGLAEGLRGPTGPRSQAAVLALLPRVKGSLGESVLRAASLLKASPGALLAPALKTANDASAPVGDRVHAVGILGLESGTRVSPFVAPQFPAEIRLAAVRALSRMPAEAAAGTFLVQWRSLTGPMRDLAIGTMMKDRKTVAMLLDAVDKNLIQPWAIGQARLRTLERHSDPAIREHATRITAATGGDRGELYKRYLPAVHRAGTPSAGKAVFQRVCVDCHELDGVGKQVGPDLRSVTKRYKEVLLANILMPSENVEPGYEEYVVETKDGRVLTGILAKETPASITLRRAKGEEDVVARADIRELRSSGTSPMPDGVEKDITVDQMADLISYLKGVR